MATSARRLTLIERAEKNVDWAAVERQRRDEAARATTERIKTLRDIAFRNASRGNRDIEALNSDSAATQLLIRASDCFNRGSVLGILEVAVDKRWADAVKTGLRYLGEQPVAALIRELWNLTEDRSAV